MTEETRTTSLITPTKLLSRAPTFEREGHRSSTRNGGGGGFDLPLTSLSHNRPRFPFPQPNPLFTPALFFTAKKTQPKQLFTAITPAVYIVFSTPLSSSSSSSLSSPPDSSSHPLPFTHRRKSTKIRSGQAFQPPQPHSLLSLLFHLEKREEIQEWIRGADTRRRIY